MNIIKDTYFFNYEVALKEALKQQNITYGDIDTDKTIFRYEAYEQKRMEFYKDLQICYYNGEPKENSPKNLIALPINEIYDFFKLSRLRFPEIINTDSTNIDLETKKELLKIFQLTFQKVNEYKETLSYKFISEIKKNKPKFSEPLRFFLMSSAHTTVLKHVINSLYETIIDLGYDAFLSKENNSMENLDQVIHLQKLAQYNPHIIINLNNINNNILNNSVFNFIWFQDPMPILKDDSVISLRKRDYVYSLLSMLDIFLKRKDISFQRQRFCIDTKIYKKIKDIKREEKIVFIGSSYKSQLRVDTSAKLIFEIVELYFEGAIFDKKCIDNLAIKYNEDSSYINTFLVPYVVRDYTVLSLLALSKEYKVEIYGWGWDIYPQLKDLYKGPLNFGEDISKVYNSAKYTLSPHSGYIFQQRVLESAACGSIPVVYDCRYNDSPPFYEESLIFFKKPSQIINLIHKKNKPKLKKLVKDHSFKKFIKRILKTVKSDLKY